METSILAGLTETMNIWNDVMPLNILSSSRRLNKLVEEVVVIIKEETLLRQILM